MPKIKVPNAPVGGIENRMLCTVKSASCEVKAADLVDNSFMGRLEKPGYVAEWMKKIGELYKEREVSILNKRDRLSRLSIR